MDITNKENFKPPQFLADRGITELLVLDFETYYDTKYTLKKMSTSLYIFDDQFLAHGVGIMKNGVTRYYGKYYLKSALKTIDWSKTALLCHHTHFDGLILSHHYDIVPAYYLDTLSMARPVLANKIKSLGIDSISKYYGLEGKTEGLDRSKGVRDLPPDIAYELGKYCENDVELTYQVFNKLRPHFTDMEMDIIHLTVNMYANPKLKVDADLAQADIDRITAEKKEVFEAVHNTFPKDLKEFPTLKVLRSGDMFARALDYNGVKPPMKISPTTGKETYAFAKSDVVFQKLEQHKNPDIQQLYKARLVSKSDTALNKAKMLKQFADHGKCPVYLNYWKAQTGRFSGGDKIQMQNLPRGGNARKSILAPPGHLLLVSDLSQIELRMGAWFSGQEDILNIFRAGKDVYKDMATKIYNIKYNDVSKDQRSVGKVACLGANTLVLTDSGPRRIIDVQLTDKVWDGKQWVIHQGLVFQGLKKTENILGISMTSDHLILVDNEWIPAKNVLNNENILFRALAQSTENLPSLDTFQLNKDEDTKDFWYNVHAVNQNIISTMITYSLENPDDVILAQKSRLLPLDLVKLYKPCQMLNIEKDFLIACHQLLEDVLNPTINVTTDMGEEELMSFLTGLQTGTISLRMFKHWKDGIILIHKWIESTMTEIMSQEILDSQPLVKITKTGQTYISWKNWWNNLDKKTPNLEKVYDLVNCGPNNRFTILNQGHSLIVHNCLGLGYGSGVNTFDDMLKAGAMGPKMVLPYEEVDKIVRTYRQSNNKIRDCWYKAGDWLEHMLIDRTGNSPEEPPPIYYKGLKFVRERVIMPNGTTLEYPTLTKKISNTNFGDKRSLEDLPEWEISIRNFEKKIGIGDIHFMGSNGVRRRIYSSLFYENIIQSLARHLICWQMANIWEKYGYDIVMSVHDEIILSIPEDKIKEAQANVEAEMRKAPSWCSDLPVDCESGFAKEYSK